MHCPTLHHMNPPKHSCVKKTESQPPSSVADLLETYSNDTSCYGVLRTPEDVLTFYQYVMRGVWDAIEGVASSKTQKRLLNALNRVGRLSGSSEPAFEDDRLAIVYEAFSECEVPDSLCSFLETVYDVLAKSKEFQLDFTDTLASAVERYRASLSVPQDSLVVPVYSADLTLLEYDTWDSTIIIEEWEGADSPFSEIRERWLEARAEAESDIYD